MIRDYNIIIISLRLSKDKIVTLAWKVENTSSLVLSQQKIS